MAKPLTLPPLSDTQVTELRQLYDTTTHAKLRLRAQIVLLAHQGRSVADIATGVFRSRDTIERVLKRFLQGGIMALPPRTAPGRAPTVTPAWQAELLRVIEERRAARDISDDALALAKENATRLGLDERVQFQKGDLLENLERFDLIVANLPYVATKDRHRLAREVLHDPEVALFGGAVGDEIVRRLIEQAPSHLNPGGLLALEIGINQAEELTEFLLQKNYHDIEAKKDYSGISRFLLARYG